MSENFVVSQTTPCSLLPHLWPFYTTCRRPTSRLDCIRYIYHVHTIWEGVTRPGNPASALLIPSPMLTPIYPSPLLQLPYRGTSHNPSPIHMAHQQLWILEPLDSLWLPLISPFPPPPPFAFSQTQAFRGGGAHMHVIMYYVLWCTYYPSMAKYDLFDSSFIQ